MLVNHLLHQLCSCLVGLVGSSDGSSLVEDGWISGTSFLCIFVRVLSFSCKLDFLICQDKTRQGKDREMKMKGQGKENERTGIGQGKDREMKMKGQGKENKRTGKGK